MVGLLLLKQMFNKSDEVVVQEWKQDSYSQHFIGGIYFEWHPPCDPSDLVHFHHRVGECARLFSCIAFKVSSDLVHFRHRVGEAGIRKIFLLSQDLHQQNIEQATEVIIDTTVQEKSITFPTDVKLGLKIIEKIIAFARQKDIKLRQSFSKELKSLKIKLRFSHHPKRKQGAGKARKRLKTIAGILLREVSKKDHGKEFDEMKAFFSLVLQQTRHSKNKIYSLHEP